jgi:hypothetical protein
MHNNFGAIGRGPDNYKDLALAYLAAGLDVDAAWYAYLKLLGTGPQGSPDNIYLIAQTRNTALTGNGPVDTMTHGGGGPVHATPNTIDSPCPL